MNQQLELGLTAPTTDRADSSVLGSVLPRWPLVLTSGAIGLILAVLYAVFGPPSHLASAVIVVEDPRATQVGVAAPSSPERYVADQIEVFRSHSVASRAADLLASSGLAPPLPTAKELAPEGNRMVITSPRDSNVIVVSLVDRRPEVALAGVDAVITAYEEIRQEEATRSSASTVEQLQRRISDLDRQLGELESQMEVGIPDEVREALEAQNLAVLTRIIELKAQLLTATDTEQIAALTTRISALSDSVGALDNILGLLSSPNLTGLLNQQNALMSRRADLTALRDSIALNSDLAATGITFVSNPSETSRADLSVPVAGALGLVIGLIAGAALARWAALRERRLTDFTEPGRILEAPLLADVPLFSLERLESRVPVRDRGDSATAEAFQFAASSLAIRLKTLDMKSISVVSGTVGDGKSTVAANLGFAATGLAPNGSRVLLIDGDFTLQTLTSMLGVPLDGIGLTDAALNFAPLAYAIHQVDWQGPGSVSVLTKGRQTVDTQSFFWSDDVRRVLEQAEEEFDLVIVDTPPLLQVAYASSLARLTDSSLIVARHGGNAAELAEVRNRLILLARHSVGYVYTQAPMRGWMADDSRPAAAGQQRSKPNMTANRGGGAR